MTALVGYTGFVGSNIIANANGNIDASYNSKNIADAFGTNPDLLIYAGLRAEKYLANNDSSADMEKIIEAENNITKIAPKKLVLISTVDVLKNPNGKDENCEVETEGLHAYGYNRYQLELWAREHFPDCLIIRLPGLYGINLKKNFIYDFINVIPFMLKKEKFDELFQKEPLLEKYYSLQENGFYKLNEISAEEKSLLKEKFHALKFTALNFTDSRNVYQFYPLRRLWNDIQIALQNDIQLLHTATEPVSAGELYKYLSGEEFVNEITSSPVMYDFNSMYAELFGGKGGYFMSKREVLDDVRRFVEESR